MLYILPLKLPFGRTSDGDYSWVKSFTSVPMLLLLFRGMFDIQRVNHVVRVGQKKKRKEKKKYLHN
ncbi:uncharacterized protein J3R85_019959 [Psidium guajava]|nr:uncharacterized protein J3R85_019959 [Psidium guajava]